MNFNLRWTFFLSLLHYHSWYWVNHSFASYFRTILSKWLWPPFRSSLATIRWLFQGLILFGSQKRFVLPQEWLSLVTPIHMDEWADEWRAILGTQRRYVFLKFGSFSRLCRVAPRSWYFLLNLLSQYLCTHLLSESRLSSADWILFWELNYLIACAWVNRAWDIIHWCTSGSFISGARMHLVTRALLRHGLGSDLLRRRQYDSTWRNDAISVS